MSSEVSIMVENISKCYQIYEQPRDRLKQFLLPRLQRVIGLKSSQYFQEFWALKGVSFDVKKGETVGIVGRNGSGKSTLLQMICGTLNPTIGSIKTYGRVVALLELGSGFNSDFTGRENVYMNGAVLGLDKEEIDQRFESIVSFAQIGEFIDQPVKNYSSGMVVRLAFSVAINVDPEILIIDEALSVGDELFQRKCFARIEAIKKSGTTILFVSHSASTVVGLCDRAIFLDGGEMLGSGDPKLIVAQYQKLLYAPNEKKASVLANVRLAINNGEGDISCSSDQIDLDEMAEFLNPNLKPTSTVAYESRGAIIRDVRILDLSGNQVNNLRRNKRYKYCYKVDFLSEATNVHFGMLIKSPLGIEIGGAVTSTHGSRDILYVEAGAIVSVEFEFTCIFNPGIYYLNAGVVGESNAEQVYLHRVLDVCAFKVLPIEMDHSTGYVSLNSTSSITYNIMQ